MRRLPGLNRRRAVLAALLAVVMSMGATAAWGYWLANGAGSGSATTGALAAPTGATATYATGASSVTVSWTASAGSPAPTCYFVTRIRTSDMGTAAACGTSASSLTTVGHLHRPDRAERDLQVRDHRRVPVVDRDQCAEQHRDRGGGHGNRHHDDADPSSSNPSVVGQTVTYTATVTPAASSGTVTFKDGAAYDRLLWGQSDPHGLLTATCPRSRTAPPGPRSITAVYGGDATHLTSTSAAVTQNVNLASTTTTLTAAPSSSVTGQSVTLTATVTVDSPGTGTPTGTVKFSNGSTVLCSAAALNGSGIATCTTSTLPVGNKTLTADYSGSTTHATSTVTTSQSTTAASTTTTLTSSAPNVAPGVTTTYTATLAVVAPGSGSPTGTVSFRDNGILQSPVVPGRRR